MGHCVGVPNHIALAALERAAAPLPRTGALRDGIPVADKAALYGVQQTPAVVGATMSALLHHPLKASTMIEKNASVHWEGSGKNGQGQISTETGALQHYPYGFSSRFGDNRQGTNPEEILAAAHAACFSMAFSFACDKAGFATRVLDTQARVRLASQGDGFVIDRIALTLTASVPGVDETRFQEIAAAAKRDCPLSKALASVAEISLQATLVDAAA